ncbi:hypothetical protein [Dyella sp. C9]|uniref:hypothetical protein n=1 Tax=Dyella sp. C9 TaxID=2202154 RepID=UPI000DEF306F|nr:hypothetical protein [Dyella sp. C9]
MLGWLAHAFATIRPSSHAAACTISRCAVPMTGAALASRLPLLGGVLYLPARCAVSASDAALPPGWLAARRELSPLLETQELVVSSMIGADGPREWIDCVDAAGHPCARLHLLPDTDYLAWDALLSKSRPLPPVPLGPEQVSCRASHAELVCFRVRRLGALDVLETLPSGPLSALGHHLAQEIARAAAVELEPARD